MTSTKTQIAQEIVKAYGRSPSKSEVSRMVSRSTLAELQAELAQVEADNRNRRGILTADEMQDFSRR